MTENERSTFDFEELPLGIPFSGISEAEQVKFPKLESVHIAPVRMKHNGEEAENAFVPDGNAESIGMEDEMVQVAEKSAETDEIQTVFQTEASAADEPASVKEDEQEPAMAEKTKWKMPVILKILVWLAVTLSASFGLAYFAWICAGDVFALSKPDRSVEVVITEADTLDTVIDKLVAEDLVEYEWLFRLYCWLANAEEKISVGTFTLNNHYDYNALLKGMQAYAGTRETTEVMIPEGYTCQQIFAALEAAGVCSVEELETAAASYMFDYAFLQHLPYGEANRLEGYLFPDTYEFYIDDTPERVLSKFLDNFGWKFDEQLQADIAELNTRVQEQMRANGFTEEEIAANEIDMHDIIIVASLVERETSGASESSKIASVIYNRITSKIYPLLEIDAAVRYGLNKWEEDLTSADLAADTPYNTRKNPGLPGGPISNPGLDSIRAALYPRSTEYYFYVLTPDGFHKFSETYYEHQDYIEEMQQSGN